MPKDEVGREDSGRALNGDFYSDRRAKAIANFQWLMQLRRDLVEARSLLANNFPGNEGRVDPDIDTVNSALRAAVVELEASRA